MVSDASTHHMASRPVGTSITLRVVAMGREVTDRSCGRDAPTARRRRWAPAPANRRAHAAAEVVLPILGAVLVRTTVDLRQFRKVAVGRRRRSQPLERVRAPRVRAGDRAPDHAADEVDEEHGLKCQQGDQSHGGGGPQVLKARRGQMGKPEWSKMRR